MAPCSLQTASLRRWEFGRLCRGFCISIPANCQKCTTASSGVWKAQSVECELCLTSKSSWKENCLYTEACPVLFLEKWSPWTGRIFAWSKFSWMLAGTHGIPFFSSNYRWESDLGCLWLREWTYKQSGFGWSSSWLLLLSNIVQTVFGLPGVGVTNHSTGGIRLQVFQQGTVDGLVNQRLRRNRAGGWTLSFS